MPPNIPIVVVIATENGSALAPLTEGRPRCLLPLVNKPLLVHTIEDIAQAGVERAIILAGRYADQVAELLGSGGRWGLSLTILGTLADETALAGIHAAPSVTIDAGVARSPCLAALLDAAAASPEGRVEAMIEGVAAGMVFHRPGVAGSACVALPGGCARLDTLAQYHGAALDALSGRFPGLSIEGRTVLDDDECELIVEKGARVRVENLVAGRALIGSYSLVSLSARLEGRVVVGSESVIDTGAKVSDSVVLGRTYVGANLDIRRAIVEGSRLIKVDTGAVITIGDPTLLAAIA